MNPEETDLSSRPKPRAFLCRCHGVQVECVTGDIVAQPDLQAIVNAANAQLLPGGGVAGAIHQAAGPGLVAECLLLAPIKPGQAVLTAGHNLPNRYVVHCLGPVYGQDESADEHLADCYRYALRLADDHGIESIGVPAISTGAFGYPFIEATEIACRAIHAVLPGLTKVKRIRLVFDSARSTNIAATLLNQEFPE